MQPALRRREVLVARRQDTTNGSDSGQVWSVSAVARATGIGQHTLRAWERRFGFPEPTRLPSGHRRYPPEQVERLRLIARALERGHRAGDVVPLSRHEVESLLQVPQRRPVETPRPGAWTERVVEAARAFDRETVVQELRRASAELGVRRFLAERASPLVEALGIGWEDGTLDIRHEHFVSDLLQDHLRTLRLPLDDAASGRPVVLAAVDTEEHTLGMLMAAVVITLAGRPVRLLGARVPVDELVGTAEAVRPAAVGLTVSQVAAVPATVEVVNEIRRRVPADVRVWVGGRSSATLSGFDEGIAVLPTVEELERELATLPVD